MPEIFKVGDRVHLIGGRRTNAYGIVTEGLKKVKVTNSLGKESLVDGITVQIINGNEYLVDPNKTDITHVPKEEYEAAQVLNA